MSATERAVLLMERWAEDNSHGYDQTYRWGERGDYDCSSAVISAWEAAGVPVKTAGATYTGNMRSTFLSCGFRDVTSGANLDTGAGLQRGDVLLNYLHHTAMFCGGGMEVEASINEVGDVTGGQPGDQTGREFLKRAYRNYPWNCVLRFSGDVDDDEDNREISGLLEDDVDEPSPMSYEVSLPEVEFGDTGELVRAVQTLLILRKCPCGADGADGEFGPATRQAVINFQIAHGLEPDGVVGEKTMPALLAEK